VKFKRGVMLQPYFDPTTKVSMVAGMLLGIFANVGSADLVKTVILAAVGAVVSFLVSQVLKALVKWVRGRKGVMNDE
jgi:hypothetical protein